MKETNRYLTAYNTVKPDFYKLAVDGRPSLTAFPDDYAKAYYVQCFRIVTDDLPVKVVAYSVIRNRAYFVIASYDRAVVSVKRYFSAVNSVYENFYNAQYANVGNVFKDRLRIKKITETEKIIPAIVTVHSQPAATGLCSDFGDYRFTSFSEKKEGISDLTPLYAVLGEANAKEEYARSHDRAPNALPQDFFNLPPKDKFNRDLENVLLKYGYYDKRHVPPEIMEDIIIDMNDIESYTFDYVVSEMLVKEKDKYSILVGVATKMALRLRYTYDEILRKLDVIINSDKLIRDMLLGINETKGYSYDIIMNMLGLAYPNAEFLAKVYAYCIDQGIPFIALTKKLGIYDKMLLAFLEERVGE